MSQILLVEDSKVQAFVALRLLRDAGFTVDHAETAEDAVKSCYEAVPDLVLLDQHLVDVSGLEVCRRIKNDNDLNGTPVLVLTASNKEKDHIASLDAGADAFLPKDGPTNELFAVMSRLLETSRGVRQAKENNLGGKPPAAARTQILVIDDSPTFRDVMLKRLVGTGFETTAAASGAEGLTLLRQQSFDVAIVDVVMPEMDGFEFCKRARQWALECNIQLGLLVMTGSNRNDVLVDALEAGADDYVSKLQEFDLILAHTTALARRISRARQTESLNVRTLEQDVVEQVESAKCELLANLRDQLCAPISSINSTLETLLSAELTDDQRGNLNSLQESANAIHALLGDAREDSRIKPSERDLAPAEHDEGESVPAEQDESESEAHDESGVGKVVPNSDDQEVDMSVIDLQSADKRIPGGSDGIRMVAEMLLVECPKMMTQIRSAVENGDAPLLKRGAHTLKGSADVFDAKRVYNAAFVLEKMGGTGDLTDVEPRLNELEDEVAKLTAALNSLVNQ